jgi:hypothetical protein
MFRPNEVHKLHGSIFISPFDLSKFTRLDVVGVVGLLHNVPEKLRHEIVEYGAIVTKAAPLYLVVLMIARQKLSLQKSTLFDEVIVG